MVALEKGHVSCSTQYTQGLSVPSRSKPCVMPGTAAQKTRELCWGVERDSYCF